MTIRTIFEFNALKVEHLANGRLRVLVDPGVGCVYSQELPVEQATQLAAIILTECFPFQATARK